MDKEAATAKDETVAPVDTSQEENDVSQGEEETQSSEEEIELDEASDTENYKPPPQIDDTLDDEEISSGDDECAAGVKFSKRGKERHFKLVYDENNKENVDFDKTEDFESDSAVIDEKEPDKVESKPSNCPNIQSLMETDMAEYKSDDDDNFNPVACGDTLSDIEYASSDQRDTESENEIEDMEMVHRKTGESVQIKKLKIVEEMKIPPDCSLEAGSTASDANQSPMECA